MSTDGPKTADQGAIERHVDGLERGQVALDEALGKMRRIRIFLLVALVAVVGVTIWKFYELAEKVRSEDNVAELMDAAQQRFNENRAIYIHELQTLADKAGPVIKTALEEQMQKDQTKFEEILDNEQSVLVENLQVGVTDALEKRQKQLSEEFERKFREKFPNAENDEVYTRMMANVEAALQRLIKKYYAEEIKGNFEEMAQTWEDFPAAEPAREGDVPLDDEMIGLLIELAQIKMAETDLRGFQSSLSAPE